MDFDDRAALDAGLASDAMRAAGRNLREIAPGLATFLVVEDARTLIRRLIGPRGRAARFPGMDTVSTTEERVTEAAPAPAPSTRGVAGQHSRSRRRRPGGRIDGVALVTIDRPEALNALSFDLLDELAAELERLDQDEACRAIVVTGAGTRAFAAGADIKELAVQTPITLTVENRSPSGTGSGRSGRR